MKTLKPISTLLILLFIILNSFGQSLISIELDASKLVFDGKRDKIYAIVKSFDANYGNSFVQINPHTGSIENSLFVGSEPICMDITKDTNYVYIGLDGASFVKRVDLNTFQIDQTISLGTGSSGPTFAKDIATVNLSPDLVVIARKRTNVTPQHDGVVAYFKGVKLQGETPAHTGSTIIDSANDTNLVFGYNDESTEAGFRRMVIDTLNGVALIDVNQISMGYFMNIKYEQGLVYSKEGHIINPYLSTPTFVGTYSNIGWNYNVEPDAENNKTFFCTVANGLKIRRYNLQTMVFMDEITLDTAVPNYFQSPESLDMIRYGDRGLAMIVQEDYFDNQDKRVILYESCLVKEGADLQVSKDFSAPFIQIGDTIDLKIIVSNMGGITAEDVLVEDTLSNTFEVISTMSSSGNIQNTGNIINWTINNLPPNYTDTATIKLHFTQKGGFLNSIHATSNTFECNSLDNILSDTVLVDSSITSTNTQMNANDLTLSIFPNPVVSDLNLDFTLQNSEEVIFSISNTRGEKIFEEKIYGNAGENQKKINLSNFSSGIYILNIKQNNNLMKKVKIVKI